MTVVVHPSSTPHFDALLTQELRTAEQLMVSLNPMLETFSRFSETIRLMEDAGMEIKVETVRELNASLKTLAEALLKQNERLLNYHKYSSFCAE